MPGIGSVLGPLTGIMGLMQGAQGMGNAQSALSQQNAALQPQLQAQSALLGQANAYNPAAQAAQSFQTAKNAGVGMLDQSLRGLSGQTMASGGSPTGDTAFNIGALNNANSIINPLLTQYAAQLNQAPQNKMAAYEGVFGSQAGNLAGNYFKNAASMAPSQEGLQGSLSALVQGLGGAGGSGLGAGAGGAAAGGLLDDLSLGSIGALA